MVTTSAFGKGSAKKSIARALVQHEDVRELLPDRHGGEDGVRSEPPPALAVGEAAVCAERHPTASRYAERNAVVAAGGEVGVDRTQAALQPLGVEAELCGVGVLHGHRRYHESDAAGRTAGIEAGPVAGSVRYAAREDDRTPCTSPSFSAITLTARRAGAAFGSA